MTDHRVRAVLVPLFVCAAIALVQRAPVPVHAQAKPSLALAGQVTSAEEGPMEGVLVSAKKTDSTITVTVVTDQQGRYRFPEGRLAPGRYTLRIRAVGYDLDTSDTVEVVAKRASTADLKLRPARDVASQLTDAEWFASLPATDEQRASVRNCAHCHTFSLVARSKHDPDEFVKVIERMSGYPPLAFPLMPQRTPSPRLGPGTQSPERRLEGWRRQAEFLSHVNLSAGPQWSYTFKTLPRPRGNATQVIYTEYDLPQRTRQPHDVIVDSQGMAWYASFGEQILGKLDPRTGKVTEYPIPAAQAERADRHPRQCASTKTRTPGSACSFRAASRSSTRRPRSSRPGACRRN